MYDIDHTVSYLRGLIHPSNCKLLCRYQCRVNPSSPWSCSPSGVFMTSTERVQSAASMPAFRKVLCAVYALIAVVAFVATWSQTVAYTHNGIVAFFDNFWHDARVNASSRNITTPGWRLTRRPSSSGERATPVVPRRPRIPDGVWLRP
ncbi:hypothetical protein PJK45_14750 [Mycobacterium kansasii]|uniref:hypothetical protein n=1 Tax=Mycobacterium kansasii TaxID=1768 RepID=UPI001056E3CD|nr:hypothetical protein [Mycobacterium kansasii]MXO37110.1 hypothetical protein [Mycobacterium kansasii]UCA20803.1 hypothetical protein LA359_05435 [Mycobacterium kansasii]UGT80856.1 hypothetical protein LTS70_25810 [Mycobacterium kansasii]UGT85134.1 hypothetical protein LTT71_19195 [Mycobacterium kansasii]UGU26631.1 hypothetical protein LT351_08315 [Mycobacterium kansasii]